MPDPTYQFLYDDKAAHTYQTLKPYVSKALVAVHGEDKKRPLAVVSWGSDTEAIGAACGVVHQGWLSVEMLWVEPAHRGKKVATGLIRQLEEEAVRMGVHSAYVFTHDFEAPEFYHRQGYETFATLEDFGPGKHLLGLRKTLLA